MGKVTKRHLEVSIKLAKMGEALIKEGTDSNDYEITRAGYSITLISGVMLNTEDTEEFGRLCELFSSKKTLDLLEETNPSIKKYLANRYNNESLNDFLGRGGDKDDETENDDGISDS